jgi:uncharacterized SAM-binding protein YcdF (DUF218 family)
MRTIMKSRKFLYCFLLLLVAIVVLFLLREPILSEVGNFLVVSDSLERADVIEVLSGNAVRYQKAAELFSQGWAPRIVITKGTYPHRVQQLKRYGISVREGHKKAAAILRFLNIPENAIEIIDGYNKSTADEARKLRRYMLNQGLKRLIVVTSNFHTRRSRLLFRRVFKGTGIAIVVQAAPPDYEFDPEKWWTRRKDSKTLLWEYQKLIYYALRYW